MTESKLTRAERGKAWGAALILLAVLVGGWMIMVTLARPSSDCRPPGNAPDPITADIYRVCAGAWAEISSSALPRGATQASTESALQQAGFTLWDEHRQSDPLDAPLRDEGYTHTFSRAGGKNLFCAERLFVRIGIKEDRLVGAEGQSHWTCL